MSGNYSRKMYDDCFQKDIIEESKGPGKYRVNPVPKSNVPCYAPESVVGSKDTMFNPYHKLELGTLVNIESHLKRMDLHDSRCVKGRTLEEMNTFGNHLTDKIRKDKKNCNRKLESTYSRMEDPALEVRSMTTSRFDFPIEDPRGQVYYGMTSEQVGDSRFGIDTRHESRNMDPEEYFKKIEKRNGFN
jgi:hypothetical protein